MAYNSHLKVQEKLQKMSKKRDCSTEYEVKFEILALQPRGVMSLLLQNVFVLRNS